MKADASERLLFTVFAAVVGSFLVATVVTESTSTRIESLSANIVSDSTASIERLASARGNTREAELALTVYLDSHRSSAPASSAPVEAALERLHADIRAYLALPTLPAEQEEWTELHERWLRFDQAVRQTLEVAKHGNDAAARQTFSREVSATAVRLIDAAMQGIEVNAQNGRVLAAQINDTRKRTVRVARTLDVVCVLLGAAGAALLHRQTRRRRALVAEHARSLETRNVELEQFAGRVAHDIRNPLAAAQLAAQLIERRTGQEEVSNLATRISTSLARADAITTGLLDFARAGAQPDPGARTSPAEVLADLEGPLTRDASAATITLTFEPVPAVLVACSTGVYLSLVSNLVRNAIKYMGDSRTRTIKVRVSEERELVRTEVVDTGSGVPNELLPSLFEPYFRVRGTGQEGLGLGLATVKKLAEGHHGRAGATSTPGRGSTFWFELPSAGHAAELAVPRIGPLTLARES
jgi:signal transduction histidine kinase